MNTDSFWKQVRKYLFLTVFVISIILYISRTVLKLNLGDTFSLGQLLVESILFPFAVAGFVYATQQFLEAQQLPEPHLYWESPEGNFTSTIKLDVQLNSLYNWTPRLILRNEGKVVTNWYLVQLDIPREIYLSNEPSPRVLTSARNVVDSHWQVEHYPDKTRWVFMSNGEFALYPNYIQPFCAIMFQFSKDEKYPNVCYIPYVIYSDRGKEKKGKLTINLSYVRE